jgi:LPS sulfotransferase NodH
VPNEQSAGVNYLICATPRTGSYLLCELLRKIGVGSPTEYFSAGYQQYWMPRWDVTDYPSYLRTAFGIARADGSACGVKAHPRQFQYFLRQANGGVFPDPAEHRAIAERWLPSCRYVWLRRRDVLRQALSWARSMQTNIWWDAAEAPAPYDEPRPDALRFDSEHIDYAIARMHTEDQMWDNYFREADVEPLVVWYEDLAVDMAGQLARVVRHLGLPRLTVLPAVEMRKQSDATTERWRQRYLRMCSFRVERSFDAARGLDPGSPDFVVAGENFQRPDAWNEARHSLLVLGEASGPFKPDYQIATGPTVGPRAEVTFASDRSAARLAAHLGADRIADVTGAAGTAPGVRVLDLGDELDLDGFLQLPPRPRHERERSAGLRIAVAAAEPWARSLSAGIDALTGHVVTGGAADIRIGTIDDARGVRVRPRLDQPAVEIAAAHRDPYLAPIPFAWWLPRNRPAPKRGDVVTVFAPGTENCPALTGVDVTDDETRIAEADVVIDLAEAGLTELSLRGLSAAAVVVNRLAVRHKIDPEVAAWFQGAPFRCAEPDRLDAVLRALLRDRDALAAAGRASRDWVCRHWDFTDQWDRYWAPAMAASMDGGGARL